MSAAVAVDHEHDLEPLGHPEWDDAYRCTGCQGTFLRRSNGALLPMHFGTPTTRGKRL